MKVVGIDVGSHSIHVLELNVQSRGFQVGQTKSLSLKPNSNPTDVDLEVIEFLRQMIATHDVASTEYVMGLRQDRVAIRHKLFPYTEKNKIAKTLPFELEDDLPFSLDNAVIDFKTIRHRGSEAEVLACATLSSNVEKILSFFKDIGATLKILCPEGLALANLIEGYDHPVPHEPALAAEIESGSITRNVELLLHIGHSHTLVCAFENKRVIAARSLFWGGKNIIDAIALKYQLPPADAAREMEMKAFILSTKQQASFEAKVFSETIATSVKDMVRDLQLSILELKTELKAEVESLLLSGPVSQIQGLGAFLTQSLEIPSNRVKLLDRFQNHIPEKNDTFEAKFVIAFGLALEGLKKPRNPAVNLLRGEFSGQKSGLNEVLKRHKSALQWAIAVTVALFIWSSWRSTIGLDLDFKSQALLKSKGETIAGLTSRNANERGIEKYIQQKKQVTVEMKSIEKVMQTETAFNILKKVSEVAPNSNQIKLDVRRFYVEDRRVWLEGFVRNQVELNLLQQNLKNLSVDGKITTQRASIVGPKDRLVFALSFLVKRSAE